MESINEEQQCKANKTSNYLNFKNKLEQSALFDVRQQIIEACILALPKKSPAGACLYLVFD